MAMSKEHKQAIGAAVRLAYARKRKMKATQTAHNKVMSARIAVSASKSPKPPAFVGRDLMIKNARRAIADLQEMLLMLGVKR